MTDARSVAPRLRLLLGTRGSSPSRPRPVARPSRRRSTGLFPAGAARGQTVDGHGLRHVRPLAGRGLGRGARASQIEAGAEKGKLDDQGRRRRRAGRPLGPALRRGRGDGAPAVPRRHAPRGRRGRAERRPETPAGHRAAVGHGQRPTRQGGRRGRLRRRARAGPDARRRPRGEPPPRLADGRACSGRLGRRVRPRPEQRRPSASTRGSSSRRPPTARTSSGSSPSPRRPTAASGSPGAKRYVYRLTLTTGGFLDHAFPLAVPPRPTPGRGRGRRLEHPRGGPLPRGSPPRGRRPDCPVLGHPLLANSATSGSSRTRPTIERAEPNPAEHPQTITLPVAISGRIDPPRDRDAYGSRPARGRMSASASSRGPGPAARPRPAGHRLRGQGPVRDGRRRPGGVRAAAAAGPAPRVATPKAELHERWPTAPTA